MNLKNTSIEFEKSYKFVCSSNLSEAKILLASYYMKIKFIRF